MTQAVKRACDACHRRKVKCDGINPCRNCHTAQLSCTYNAIPQKKGPKGSRAKVISELRETQRQTSLSAKVQNRINGLQSSGPDPNTLPTPGLLSPDLIKDCLNFFFDNLYTQMPILDRRQVEQQAIYLDQNRDAYCLITSLCAFVMLQPGMTLPTNDPYDLDRHPGTNIASCQLLLEECFRVRKGTDFHDSINLNVLATSYFIYGCYEGQSMHDKAWYYLREATTMACMAGMNKEEYYAQLERSDAVRRRRLFWLLLVTERQYALERHRPVTLQPNNICLPTMDDDTMDPQAHQLNSHLMTVNMFSTFDDSFVASWNKARERLSAQLVTNLGKQLDEQARMHMCQDPSLADLGRNQEWLRGILYGPPDQEMYNSQVRLNMASSLISQGVEVANAELCQNLLQTCFALNEVLPSRAPSRSYGTWGPREYLDPLLRIIGITRRGDYRFVPLLLSKATEALRKLASPMLLDPPETPVGFDMRTVDIFDGFGNAGLGQPAMQMSMEPDYNQKFPMDDYEKKYQVDMSGSTPESMSNTNVSNGTPPSTQQANEMNTSFVSSPSVMSPGMEYPHNMDGFMSDMIMSPLGNMPNQQQHIPNPGDGMCRPQINSLASQGMHNQGMNGVGMPGPHSMNNMYNMRQAPQRQGSFQMQSQASIAGMGAMPSQVDFGSMR